MILIITIDYIEFYWQIVLNDTLELNWSLQMRKIELKYIAPCAQFMLSLQKWTKVVILKIGFHSTIKGPQKENFITCYHNEDPLRTFFEGPHILRCSNRIWRTF